MPISRFPAVVVLALVLMAFTATTASAATVAVDAADVASDADGCGGGTGGAADPCNTIQAGVDAADDADTLQIAAGMYSGAVTVAKANLTLAGPQLGTAGYAREFPSSPASEAVLECPDGSSSICIDVTAGGVTIAGLALQHSAQGTMVRAAGVDVTVADNVMADANPAVRFEADGATAIGNAVYGEQPAGLRSAQGFVSYEPVADLYIADKLFDGLRDQAILVIGGVAAPPNGDGIAVYDNLITDGSDTPGSGLTIGRFDNVAVERNVILGTSAGIGVYGASNVAIASNV